MTKKPIISHHPSLTKCVGVVGSGCRSKKGTKIGIKIGNRNKTYSHRSTCSSPTPGYRGRVVRKAYCLSLAERRGLIDRKYPFGFGIYYVINEVIPKKLPSFVKLSQTDIERERRPDRSKAQKMRKCFRGGESLVILTGKKDLPRHGSDGKLLLRKF
jgi:hypothetical protein